METANGKIIALREGVATVRVDTTMRCPRCAEGRGCGAALFGARADRDIEMPVTPGTGIAEGDDVVLTLAPRRLFAASLAAYGIPLGAMLLAIALAWLAAEELGDGEAVTAALAGLALGVGMSRRRLGRDDRCRHFVPELHPGSRPLER